VTSIRCHCRDLRNHGVADLLNEQHLAFDHRVDPRATVPGFTPAVLDLEACRPYDG
jgi:hypothetical protein